MAAKQLSPALRNVIGWALLVSIAFIAFGVLLGIASWLSKSTQFGSGFLSNLAAESLGVGFSILAASAVGWMVARKKVVKVTPAIFRLIQKLRIDGTITSEAAQRSVICAVALMSEGNINNAISREADGS